MFAANTQGIPEIPDLTHPSELVQLGSYLFQGSLVLVFLVLALGLAIAILSFVVRRQPQEQTAFLAEWAIQYSQLLRGLQHFALENSTKKMIQWLCWFSKNFHKPFSEIGKTINLFFDFRHRFVCQLNPSRIDFFN